MNETKGEEEPTRVAVVDPERCKPSRCQQECKKICPVVRMGKACIEVSKDSKQAVISEVLCNPRCNMCVKKCPFQAIHIERIPRALTKENVFRYGPNLFQLHRLPLPRPSHVLGLIGANSVGKSTCFKLMAGRLKPNFGKSVDLPWKEIIREFRGSEWQNLFTKIMTGEFEAKVKPQYVDQIAKLDSMKNATVKTVLLKVCQEKKGDFETYASRFELTHLLDSLVSVLSGGELQRLAIASCLAQRAKMYLLDEPSSYLDIRQRIMVANWIRETKDRDYQPYIVVVEHDLSMLDYMSETVCCMYGQPGVYGVVTLPFNVREGINHYLSGFIPTENMRFRPEALVFQAKMRHDDSLPEDKSQTVYSYEPVEKTLGGRFQLMIEKGTFRTSEIVVLLAMNGAGKTQFLKYLKTTLKLQTSYKPQQITPKWKGTVETLFNRKIPLMFHHELFRKEVVTPLQITNLLDRKVQELSGGELQRVAIVLALGMPADVYLLDEPSAYLDCEQRIIVAQVIKRFILQSQKAAFVVEHDFIMLNYLGDRIIVFEGTPGIKSKARTPMPLATGVGLFLKSVNVTIRRDPTNFRPRINKLGSVKDQMQKKLGIYFDTTLEEETDKD